MSFAYIRFQIDRKEQLSYKIKKNYYFEEQIDEDDQEDNDVGGGGGDLLVHLTAGPVYYTLLAVQPEPPKCKTWWVGIVVDDHSVMH